jgi:hypothetical protein
MWPAIMQATFGLNQFLTREAVEKALREAAPAQYED